ncbi:MAG: hypothetical protein ACI8ZM_002494, partial [Crocinitomix sp.]
MSVKFQDAINNNIRKIENENFDSIEHYAEPRAPRVVKTFKDCTFTNTTEIFLYNGVYTFENCTFSSTMEIAGITAPKSSTLIFHNCTFNSSFEISGILHELKLNNCSVPTGNHLFLHSSKFSNLTISNVDRFIDQLKIGSIPSTSTIKLCDLNCNELIFEKRIKSSLSISGGNYGTINFSNPLASSAHIYGSIENDSPIIIQKLTVPKTISAGLSLTFAKINDLDFSYVKNSGGQIKFERCEFIGEVDFQNTDLTGAHFNGVNFECCKLYLNWAYLTAATFTNVLWPSKKIIYPNLAFDNRKNARKTKNKGYSSQENPYNTQREAYRQLKSISIKNHNQLDAIEFYRNEMRVYWRFIKTTKSGSIWDRFLIRVNRSVSNFGQSYARPLIWLNIVHAIFCLLAFGWTADASWDSFEYSIGRFFYTLNPVHKLPEGIHGYAV